MTNITFYTIKKGDKEYSFSKKRDIARLLEVSDCRVGQAIRDKNRIKGWTVTESVVTIDLKNNN